MSLVEIDDLLHTLQNVAEALDSNSKFKEADKVYYLVEELSESLGVD